MALTNSEKQAAHRASKKAVFEQISQELAATTAENRDLREKLAGFEAKISAMQTAHAKKVASLEKRLLTALEKMQATA